MTTGSDTTGAGTAPVTVERVGRHIAVVTLRRPPHNYFDVPMVRRLADLFDEADADPSVRAIVLAAQGRGFCAGANFGGDGDRTAAIQLAGPQDDADGSEALYAEAVRVFSIGTPVVAAVHGIAIGGGFGLAVSADFRVGTPATRFCANFARLGLHQGFGLSVSLPRVIGEQHALDMLLTARRVDGVEAFRFGLVDRLVDVPAGAAGSPDGERAAVRDGALALAAELAESAPLAVRSIRATQRAALAEQVARATGREAAEQRVLRGTADFAEGVAATAERRPPRFAGR